MYIGYSEEQEQLRRELRAYYDKLLTPEVEEGLARGHGIGPVNRQVVRQMGEDGWLGIGWPKEYGGRGMTPIEQFVFFCENVSDAATNTATSSTFAASAASNPRILGVNAE